jgi:flagellin-like protein
MRINKRGLSPVITTVLLIAIAVVLAIIILLWARGWLKEAVTKDGRPIENVCSEVSFEASPVDHGAALDEVIVTNTGNINIYSFSIENKTLGRIDVAEKRAQNITGGNEIDLGRGASGNFSMDFTNVERIIIRPVLLGLRGEVVEEYACNNHPGEELEI